MTDEPKICPKCGFRLPGDSPRTACPSCCAKFEVAKPKKKPAAKKVIRKEPPRKRGPKGRFLKD